MIMFGAPAALLASLVAIFVDRPKGFAIAALAISGSVCLLFGGLIVFMIVVMSQL